MAEPARKTRPESPPRPDPVAVQREYRRRRAMRQHRERRTRERRAANIRFWIVVVALLALSVYLGFEMWKQVQGLFGL